MPVTTTLAEEKSELRKEMARRRRQAMDGAAPDLAERLLASFATISLGEAAAGRSAGAGVASGYLPIRSELDPRPVMASLADAGWRLALPVVVAANSPLQFRAYSFGDALVKGRFDTEVPGDDKQELVPSLLLVPLLAFDRRGYRLGYGGGFYDRSLTLLRRRGPVLAVGLAFREQEIERVPADKMDQRLDWIVTQGEAIRIGGPS